MEKHLRQQRHSRQIQLIRPNPPVNLTASATTKTKTELSWDAVSHADGYNIYKNGVKSTTVTGTSHTASGLTASTEYDFYVTAISDKHKTESGASNVVTITTTA